MLGSWRDPRIRLRSGKFGRLTNRYNRWFAIGIAAILMLVAVGLAFVPWPAFLPDGREFFGTLDRSLITPAVLVFAAYFYFYFLTAHRATRELLRVAQQTPERLFPYSPEAGSAKQVFGRGRLVKEIADGMHSKFGAGPQIVVGDTGSGKTTLLLALASQLAKDHFILPIVLSLRDTDNDLENYDFAGLAVKRFGSLVDPYIKTEAEADKLWRWMCKKRRIVVLADDLDRSNQAKDPYKTQIRLALDKARARNLPLVVTTRPAGLPPDLREPPIDLSDWPLEGKSRAARYVMRRAGRADQGDDVRGLVEENIEAGELLENAFYLTLLTRLLRIGKLGTPSTNGNHAVRVALLDADRERLCGKGMLDPDECRRRDEALRGVENLAAAWLVPKEEPGFEPRWVKAVRDGERFGLLSLDEEEHPQFKHEVLHAYFASRAISAGDSSWKESLAEGPNKARVQLALVLTAARGECDEFCREVSEMLLADSPNLTADLRQLRAAAAAEIGRAGSFSGLDTEIAASCIASKRDAGPVAKRATLEQLEALGGEGPVEALWLYAHDEEYGTRWTAVECLVRRCSKNRTADGEKIRPPFGVDAYEVLDPKIEAALDAARPLLDLPEDDRPDDWDTRIVLLKQLAWMLPALRTGAKEPELRRRIEGRLDDLLALEQGRVTIQRGLEASVAQGFKADAKLHPSEPPDPYAEEMLRERAVFWYSQLNLVHALALRMAKDPDSSADSLVSTMAAVERRECAVKDGAAVPGGLHPMLGYAAKLCVKALKGDAGPERFKRVRRQVWGDEGVVVSGRPRRLDRAAAQLVGEIAILLNLNETGSPLQRKEFGEEPTLPRCLQTSRLRRELHDGCSKDCRFGLCPFQPTRDEPSAHREISRAFCRDQRLHANALTARRWGSRVIPGALPEFWRWLEGQARF